MDQILLKKTESRRKMRLHPDKLFGFPVIILLVLAIFGCNRYYTAEIAGYVKDSESEGGINGTVVKLYLSEDAMSVEDGYIVKTASMNSNGNDGYFNHKIIWQNNTGAFGEEGDSGMIWLSAEHDDYTTVSVQVLGILSDTVNVIPDILMDRATFEVPTVTGRVVDVNGDGVNGIRMVLDLASTTDEDEDYVTTTATIDGATGTYRFQNVTWKDDANAGNTSDDEPADISVSDTDYSGDQTLSITLTSGQDREINDEIVAIRNPRSDFTANVQGRVLRRITTANGTTDIAVQGVEVKLVFIDNQTPANETVMYDQTDNTGTYTFFVQWKDTFPGDYDVEGANDGTDDSSIPEGEDGLLIEVYFLTPFQSANPYVDFDGGSPGVYDSNDQKLRSWQNPNYLPDTVDES